MRHFSQLAALDISTIPQAQEKIIKHSLVSDRLARKWKTYFFGIAERCAPLVRGWKKIQQLFRDTANKVADQYRQLEWKKQWVEWRGRDRHERRAHILGLLEKADTLRHEQKYKEAEPIYVEVISLEPKNVSAYFGLGKNYWRAEKFVDAEQAFQHIVETLDHNHVLAWAFLGRTLKAQNKWAAAAAAFERALQLDGSLAKRWVDLGDCVLELGGVAEAKVAYKKAVATEPNNPWVLDRYIETSIISGDKRHALEALAQLKLANPDNQKVEEWEKRIREM